MMKPEPKKIVIIENNLAYRDYLRSIISELGNLSFCFQNEATCLDNLDVLNPDLLIVGSLNREGMVRLINALQLIEYRLSALLMGHC